MLFWKYVHIIHRKANREKRGLRNKETNRKHASNNPKTGQKWERKRITAKAGQINIKIPGGKPSPNVIITISHQIYKWIKLDN